jgi:hypothetical protein
MVEKWWPEDVELVIAPGNKLAFGAASAGNGGSTSELD